MTQGIVFSPGQFAGYEPAGTWQAATPLDEAMAADTAPMSEAVYAAVNHGRWIVACPDCNGAQLGCLADHRFMCNECANVAIGGLWRPVIWPEEFQAMASVLAERERHLQNYEPGETLKDLKAQNEQIALAKDLGVDPGSMTAALAASAAQDNRASEHEGHTHRWPAEVSVDGTYTCSECGHEVPGVWLTEGPGVRR